MTDVTTLKKTWIGAVRFNLRKQIAQIRGKKAVHLLHIGKTGGTAIKAVFSTYPETPRYLLLNQRHAVRLQDIPVGEKVVFMTRDPISRYVSGFISRLRQGLPRHRGPWSEAERIAFQDFTTPNELAVALSSENEDRRQKAVQAMKGIYHVRSSMWDWFGDEQYLQSRLDDILFAGRQEYLSADFEALKKKLLLPEEASLPVDDVAAHRTPDHFDKKLSDEAVANLKQWYAREYDFLEMCRKVLPSDVAPSYQKD